MNVSQSVDYTAVVNRIKELMRVNKGPDERRELEELLNSLDVHNGLEFLKVRNK